MDGEGEGTFNTSEGAGLADGQGAKDVSDQVQATSLSSQSYCSTLLFLYIRSHILSIFFTTEDLNREEAQFSLSMFLEYEFNTNQKGSAISLFLPLIHKYWCLHNCVHKIPPSVLLSG